MNTIRVKFNELEQLIEEAEKKYSEDEKLIHRCYMCLVGDKNLNNNKILSDLLDRLDLF